MPSRSKSQQRLFGMVSACQKTGRCASPEVERIAGEVGEKAAREFAKTKHKGLPKRVRKKKKAKTFREWLDEHDGGR